MKHSRSGRLWGVIALVCTFAIPSCKTSQTTDAAAQATPGVDLVAEALLFGDDAKKAELAAALAKKGPDYVPRTKHKNDDGSPKYTNRLILTSSPYLLQHAHNPVNWFSWGDEAFEIARKLGRPVFLSVGYSTCHWCHVMEEESFEDEAIAKYINDNYIPIKVDREERPDVDAIYMRSVQLMTKRGGGWPMSVWMTAERKPFYGGTYFPPRDGVRGARKGFLTILTEQKAAFDKDPAAIANDAERIALRVKNDLQAPSTAGLPTVATVHQAAAIGARRYDPMYGGAKGSPKFPSSFPIRFLLRYGLRANRAEASEMAVATLRKMQAGGMYDHAGGGFHRYSVDEHWLVPHFEKMLYDNALLTIAYLEGFQASGEADFARVARETLDYIDREMTAPGGGYYSATDADSLTPAGHREEGYYFTWTSAELDRVLDQETSRIITAYYGVSMAGNFEGRNILNTPKPRAEVAKSLGITVEALNTAVAAAAPKLRAARDLRPKPIRDDKIQVSWSGLMISAMARGSRVLSEPRYRANAEKAARFIIDKMLVDGRLKHSHKDGVSSGRAFAEDHAFFAAGLLDLFEATQNPEWLSTAVMIMDLLEKHHRAASTGGFYRTADDAEQLLAREVQTRDGAIPSAGSLALMNELRIWALTTDDNWRTRAEKTLKGYGSVLNDSPWSLDEMMLAVDFYTDAAKEVALILPEGTASDSTEAKAMLAVLSRGFVPNHVLVVTTPSNANGPALSKLVPWVASKPAKKDKRAGAAADARLPTAYVCERGACDLPTTDPAVFKEQLSKPKPYDVAP